MTGQFYLWHLQVLCQQLTPTIRALALIKIRAVTIASPNNTAKRAATEMVCRLVLWLAKYCNVHATSILTICEKGVGRIEANEDNVNKHSDRMTNM